ncbi:MAG: oligosaccharide flippase family protein, partial [Candidatus Gastranaerophilales bacterium]|nr:oligosaccharide flippase family protein [Candidatus Gastranaerophilales bacterium]
MRDINKDIIKYAPAKIVGMLMNLAVVPIYTSLLIPEQYGLYNVTIGFLSLIAIIFSDWVGLSALRFFKEYFKTDNVKDFFNSTLFILISNLLLMYILVFLAFDFIKEQFKLPQEHIMLVLVLIIPVAFRALMFQILRAQIKPGTYSIITIFNQLATIALSVMFIKYFNLESKGILWGMLVSITIVDLILLVLSKLSISSEIKKIDVRDLGGFYRYGVPIALSSFGLWAITQSNKFVIQY